jgi:two-component system, LytTR family, response regulator
MKKILIVDDSCSCKQILELHLKFILPCIIETASGGQEALNIIDNRPYEFDLIFIDLKMPIMSGFEFAKKYKGNAKLIAYTAYNPLYINKSQLEQFDYLLIKPALKEDIKKLLKDFN